MPWIACLLLVVGADEPKPLEIGKPMPTWEKLAGADGKKHSAEDLRDAEAVAIVFFDNHCPDCSRWSGRIVALAKKHEKRKVPVVLVSLADPEEFPKDSRAEMRMFVQKTGFPGQYLKDVTTKTGRKFGATVTPEVFLFGKDRKLVYRGAVDDHWNPEKVEHRWLDEAIAATLAGKPVAKPVTEAVGCFIEYPDTP